MHPRTTLQTFPHTFKRSATCLHSSAAHEANLQTSIHSCPHTHLPKSLQRLLQGLQVPHRPHQHLHTALRHILIQHNMRSLAPKATSAPAAAACLAD
jgi:hypothetical protein